MDLRCRVGSGRVDPLYKYVVQYVLWSRQGGSFRPFRGGLGEVVCALAYFLCAGWIRDPWIGGGDGGLGGFGLGECYK